MNQKIIINNENIYQQIMQIRVKIQYCAKVMQTNFDKIRGFSGLFKEISLRAIFPRYLSAFS